MGAVIRLAKTEAYKFFGRGSPKSTVFASRTLDRVDAVPAAVFLIPAGIIVEGHIQTLPKDQVPGFTKTDVLRCLYWLLIKLAQETAIFLKKRSLLYRT